MLVLRIRAMAMVRSASLWNSFVLVSLHSLHQTQLSAFLQPFLMGLLCDVVHAVCVMVRMCVLCDDLLL